MVHVTLDCVVDSLRNEFADAEEVDAEEVDAEDDAEEEESDLVDVNSAPKMASTLAFKLVSYPPVAPFACITSIPML
jgi:hypothetical protein